MGEHQLDKLGVTGSSPVPPIVPDIAPSGTFPASYGNPALGAGLLAIGGACQMCRPDPSCTRRAPTGAPMENLPARCPGGKLPGWLRPPILRRLCEPRLREPVAALVRRLVPELVAEQLNGHALAATVAIAGPEMTEEPPLAAEGTPDRGKRLRG